MSDKRVFALSRPEIPQLEMANVLQNPVFALPGCQRISVNTLLCDTLGLADLKSTPHERTYSRLGWHPLELADFLPFWTKQ